MTNFFLKYYPIILAFIFFSYKNYFFHIFCHRNSFLIVTAKYEDMQLIKYMFPTSKDRCSEWRAHRTFFGHDALDFCDELSLLLHLVRQVRQLR